MMGVLLESRARRQRRAGGMALSVVTHLAIVGAATAATVHGKSAPKPDKPVVVHIVPPPAPAPVERSRTSAPRSASPSAPNIVIDRIPIPTNIPTTLPPIDLMHTLPSDPMAIAIGGPPAEAGGPRSIVDGGGSGDAPDGNEWRGNELLMRIVTSGTPRYPEDLRRSGIDGRVLLRFTIDTTGRIDLSSVQVVQSTHDLFTRAVRDALGKFRFRPAEVGSRKIAALAEMPFEFRIAK